MSRFAQEKDPEILHKAIVLLQNHNRALATKISELLQELALAKGDSGFQQLRIAALEKSLAKLTKEIFGPSTEQRPAGATADGNDDDKSKDDEKKKGSSDGSVGRTGVETGGHRRIGGRPSAPSSREGYQRARFGQGRVLAVLASGAPWDHPVEPGDPTELPAAPGGSARSLALRCARWSHEDVVDGAEGAAGGAS